MTSSEPACPARTATSTRAVHCGHAGARLKGAFARRQAEEDVVFGRAEVAGALLARGSADGLRHRELRDLETAVAILSHLVIAAPRS